MKKLLMASLVLAMGTISLAKDPNITSSNIKVTAEITEDNLIISDLNGRPIVLDFGKISNQKAIGETNAKIDFKVTKVGGNKGNVTLALVGLNDKKIDLLNTNVGAKELSKKLPASIELNKTNGTFDEDQYIGFIQGTIRAKDSYGKQASTYENVLELKATAN